MFDSIRDATRACQNIPHGMPIQKTSLSRTSLPTLKWRATVPQTWAALSTVQLVSGDLRDSTRPLLLRRVFPTPRTSSRVDSHVQTLQAATFEEPEGRGRGRWTRGKEAEARDIRKRIRDRDTNGKKETILTTTFQRSQRQSKTPLDAQEYAYTFSYTRSFSGYSNSGIQCFLVL